MKSTALPLPSTGSRSVAEADAAVRTVAGDNCATLCDPVGAGLVHADRALAAVPLFLIPSR